MLYDVAVYHTTYFLKGQQLFVKLFDTFDKSNILIALTLLIQSTFIFLKNILFFSDKNLKRDRGSEHLSHIGQVLRPSVPQYEKNDPGIPGSFSGGLSFQVGYLFR